MSSGQVFVTSSAGGEGYSCFHCNGHPTYGSLEVRQWTCRFSNAGEGGAALQKDAKATAHSGEEARIDPSAQDSKCAPSRARAG